MSEILNPRVNKLIKDGLTDYLKYFGGFLVITLVIRAIIGYTVSETVDNVGIISLWLFVGTMFVIGIVASAELPMHVRQGIARGEYFRAEMIVAIIASVLLIPNMWFYQQLAGLIVGSDSINYVFGSETNLLILLMHSLLFVVFYLIGYLLATFYQYFGWQIGVLVTIVGVVIIGIASLNSISSHNSFGLSLADFILEADSGNLIGLTTLIAPELLGPILIMAAAVITTVIYVLIKYIPIKLR